MSRTEGELVFQWIAANTLAWALGSGTLLRSEDLWGWAACGALVGTAQWLVLRRRLALAPVWIAGTSLAWFVLGWTASFASNTLMWPIAAGATVAGLAQYWTLKRRASRPALWLPATIAGFILAWMAGLEVGVRAYGRMTEFAAYSAGGAAGGAVMGAFSAPALVAMLRRPPCAVATHP